MFRGGGWRVILVLWRTDIFVFFSFFYVFSCVFICLCVWLPVWPVTEKARCLLAIATLGVNYILLVTTWRSFSTQLPYLPVRVSVKHRPG